MLSAIYAQLYELCVLRGFIIGIFPKCFVWMISQKNPYSMMMYVVYCISGMFTFQVMIEHFGFVK